ncbi:MAG: 50S ribosomal protein L6 [Clostridiales bacterium]|jgi:large subunit ribosomal protein L6|nr:50S ribosomal protein L6 [Clostridiales bacterium]
MSRIGRTPIVIPAGVTVNIKDNLVEVKGPLGALSRTIANPDVKAQVIDGKVVVTRDNEQKETKAAHGLYRMLIANMVEGVSKGFAKSLVINGVGYKAAVQGDKLVLSVGYSHNVELEAPQGIKVETASPTEIVVKGIDKEAVGQFAATIKAIRKPEPYHGYGIRYKDETIIRKEGKAAGKK